MLRAFFLSSSLIALAACGGSGGGGTSFDDILSEFEANSIFTSDFDDDDEYLQFSELQAAGGARYEGEAIIYSEISDFDIEDFDIEDMEEVEQLLSPTLVGSVALQTSFSGDEGTLTGSFSDFVDSDGNRKSGSITVSDGEVYQDDLDDEANFAGNLDGTLTGSGSGSGRYQGLFAGNFVGDGVYGTGGGLPLTVTTDIDDFTEGELDDLEDAGDAFVVIFAAD
jgi:hypothetical protein